MSDSRQSVNERQTAETVARMVTSSATHDLLRSYGLDVHSVTWEDTGRYKGSCWGPNISDMTLIVKEGQKLMPVIRKPNFSDVTQDVPVESFRVNYKGAIISLKELLTNLSLWDDRDSVILSSAQCCVLPCSDAKTEFALQLFNYQSRESDPAVLVILVTRNGTSIQVVSRDNTRLYFDNNGSAHWLTAERLEDVRKRAGASKTRVDSFKEMTAEEKLDNSIMMIQVPLKQRMVSRGAIYGGALAAGCAAPKEIYFVNSGDGDEESCDGGLELFSASSAPVTSRGRGAPPATAGVRKMDMAQLGIGSRVETYAGTRGLTLVRDTNLPIRCTFQYYRVTDGNLLSEKDVVDIKEQLEQMNKASVAGGSLVMSDSDRKTEPASGCAAPPEPANWGGASMSSF